LQRCVEVVAVWMLVPDRLCRKFTGSRDDSRLPFAPDYRSDIDDDDALGFEIIVERFGTVLTAEAA
jgi:hypothetical protein